MQEKPVILEIRDLHARVEDKEILRGINLTVRAGETHAIMGLNGSGKSTLAQVLAGREEYEVTGGEVLYKGENLLDMDPDVRAQNGVFLAFQYPVEIPGVNTSYFLRAALNSIRKAHGQEEMDATEFLKLVRAKMGLVELDKSFLSRSINEGFSGGEKKKFEVFQMAILEPTLGILDETDSGLDVDALRTVGQGVNALKSDDNAFIVVTHYQRLLNYIVPDFVHILMDGRIVQTGDKQLAIDLDATGYKDLQEAAR